MRANPQEVRAWFADASTEGTITARVEVLRADPNWRALSFPGPSVWTLNLLYWPTGERLEIVLRRDDALWHVRA